MSRYAVEVRLQAVERYLTGNESYQTIASCPVVQFLEDKLCLYSDQSPYFP